MFWKNPWLTEVAIPKISSWSSVRNALRFQETCSVGRYPASVPRRPSLRGVRDHLFQVRRITGEIRGQQTRGQRIRALDLAGRRCPGVRRPPAIQGHRRQHFVGRADGGVEMNEAIEAVQIVAQLVRKIDIGDVVTSACRHRQIRCHIERIRHEGAQVLVDGVDAHRSWIAIGDRGFGVFGCIDEQAGWLQRAAAN